MLNRQTSNLFSWFGVMMAAHLVCAVVSVHAQIPTKIQEHLWADPGPEQSEEGAPRLLVVYPGKQEPAVPFSQEATRYAGRVEPKDAEVTLNGTKLEVFEGGVFTGLIPLEVGTNQVEVIASKGGKATTVEREIERRERIKPAVAWPLGFRKDAPVSPGGKYEYWLRPGSVLKVKVFASPGHKAWVRAGETGTWAEMKAVEATEDQGGAYEAEIVVDDSFSATAQKIQFKIEGSEKPGGKVTAKTHISDLKLRKLAPDEVIVGEVTTDHATYLRNPEGFARYGNWGKGVRFPIWERFSDRVSVRYDAGEPGFIELVSMKVLPKETKYTLSELKFRHTGLGASAPDTFKIEFEASVPPPCVFLHESSDTSERLTLRILGGVKLESSGNARYEVRHAGEPGHSLMEQEMRDPPDGTPSEIIFNVINRNIWGYGWKPGAKGRLDLVVAVQPPPRGPGKRPLEGLKIMVDAGHGGSDTGALGPSGLRESDVNLVLAGFLGGELKKRGAVIQQTRSTDVKIELDDRVRMAEKFGADMFLSVHHNSVAMQTDPLKDKGPKLFHHHPHAKGLADELEARLVGLMTPGEPPRVYPEVFRVMRNISFCPSVLIEGGFVCHPEDEIRLRDTGFLKKMAVELAEGVVAALKDAPAAAGDSP